MKILTSEEYIWQLVLETRVNVFWKKSNEEGKHLLTKGTPSTQIRYTECTDKLMD